MNIPKTEGAPGEVGVVVLSAAEVAAALPLPTCIEVVAAAFVAHAARDAKVFPVVREQLANGGVFGIKSGAIASRGLLGLKAGGYWATNPERGLPAHQSIVTLFDPATGRLRALLDGNIVTVLRTAAAGALAARALAPATAREAVVIGGGVQGVAQTHALAWARPGLERVRVAEPSDAQYHRFLSAVAGLGIRVERVTDLADAVAHADVVVTATSSASPIVRSGWVTPGTHVSAIGTDTRGKQELDPEIFRSAVVVVDDWDQARTIGECQHAHALGFLERAGIHAELGAILAGTRPGRLRVDDVTVFDATGMAVQDLVAAEAALVGALERGAGTRVRLADFEVSQLW